MPGDLAASPRQKKGVVLRQLGEETLLYDPEMRKVHVLNKTSLFIWSLCTGKHSLGAIELELQRKFNVEREVARGDVQETIGVFAREGLLGT